jgi:ABC-type bacteriocin/lantibiotic exporter with double-glycine peptidase domain
MSIELPLYRQEKDNTCALACLRMILAAFGTKVAERVLESMADMEEEGTLIDEVERLARSFGLSAEIQDLAVHELQEILSQGKFPIAYIDRAVFELRPSQRGRHSIRDAIIHTVVPTRVTTGFVTIHDPRLLRPSRKTRRLFQQAYMSLGGRCVVCGRRV